MSRDMAETWKRANRASKRYFEDQDTEINLDLALGKPEDVSAYRDCVQGARWEAFKAREQRA